jgi:hypothetical protein
MELLIENRRRISSGSRDATFGATPNKFNEQLESDATSAPFI